MNPFDESSPFDSIVREFFGSSRGPNHRGEEIIRGEEEERTIDFIEDQSHVFLVFELPGHTDKDILVVVNNQELEISAQKQAPDGIQGYLAPKLSRGSLIKKTLPKFINPKKFSHTMKNGVLEIKFSKK